MKTATRKIWSSKSYSRCCAMLRGAARARCDARYRHPRSASRPGGGRSGWLARRSSTNFHLRRGRRERSTGCGCAAWSNGRASRMPTGCTCSSTTPVRWTCKSCRRVAATFGSSRRSCLLGRFQLFDAFVNRCICGNNGSILLLHCCTELLARGVALSFSSSPQTSRAQPPCRRSPGQRSLHEESYQLISRRVP